MHYLYGTFTFLRTTLRPPVLAWMLATTGALSLCRTRPFLSTLNATNHRYHRKYLYVSNF
jgi:hypothetical protein